MNSALYEGWMRHRRRDPVPHAFRSRLFMMYLDLDELDRAFAGRWLWSARRPAPAWFRRGDFLGDPEEPLKRSVHRLVEQETGVRLEGPVRLLTHLRYLGYSFNPISLYYCFDSGGQRLDAVVAEVRNTPWGERHPYVLVDDTDEMQPLRRHYRFAKRLHVSPFMDMDYRYDMRLTVPGESLAVHIENQRHGRAPFDATLALRRRPLSGPVLAGALARFPWMTGSVVAAIYWQALRLWWKGVPYVPPPKPETSLREPNFP